MSVVDIIALITGIIGVILTIKQSIWCWPFALTSVIISIVVFFQQRLFGDMSLNIFYLISGVYGWIVWEKKKNEIFIISKTPVKWYIIGIFITIVQSIIYYFLLKYFKSDLVIYDAILTACSLTCTFYMIKKRLENWLIWVVIDVLYVFLYIQKELYLYATLSLALSIAALIGYYSWKKIYQNQL